MIAGENGGHGHAPSLQKTSDYLGKNSDVMEEIQKDIKGLTADSRQVHPGYLFAALQGSVRDGRAYIDEAVARGAKAVLAVTGTKLTARGVSLIEDDNPRRLFAQIAATFYGLQPRVTVAVTGTNGKTSVASFVRQIWTHLGFTAGSLGTLGMVAPGLTVPSALTTPDPAALHTLLANLADHGTAHVALEASSHGLDQFRLDGVHLAAAAFTNLTRDHLDYHGTMVAYMQAKLRLFTELLPLGAVAVLNADDPAFTVFRAAAVAHGAWVLSYGLKGDNLRLIAVMPTQSGQKLDLHVQGHRFKVHLPLVGFFQIMNALCALGLVIAVEGQIDAAIAALETLESVPGRLQWAARRRHGAPIYVDYAHTPAALETVLTALRPRGRGRLLVVFGCGGDRDRGKRPQMGAVAARLADVVIITDDNPRSETPAAIRAEISAVCPGAYDIGNRAVAIQTAVSALLPDDVLLVAGKGHEHGQIIGNSTVLLFNDVAVCQRAVAQADTSLADS
ncbi:UDP-N-acetylmuramoylalanyl-D-glutamate--2,6-diaminopimelate ligase [invertebrate metagenome]|uniref:UDP-N-acetylmuramoylalanyl-D-glutamate--2,6-diaminopimelate ligase n=1 Tax=invertebrate metagenome TaxID=1711999 RepID=A0A484HAS6_9ZZZZ